MRQVENKREERKEETDMKARGDKEIIDYKRRNKMIRQGNEMSQGEDKRREGEIEQRRNYEERRDQ